MGLLDAVGAGLAEAGGAAAKVGMEGVRAAIEQARDERLNEMKLEFDSTTRERNKADAEDERARVSEFMKPEVSQANGLLSQGAGLNDADSVGADENVGRDVQNRERPATYKQGAERAAVAGDLKSAAALEGMDNADEKIKTAQVIAEMRQKYNTDRLTQQGQLAMMKLAQAIAKGANDGKLPADAQMIEYLVKEGIVKDKAAGAEWVKQGKSSDPSYVTKETKGFDENGNETKATVKSRPGAANAQPSSGKKPIKFSDLK